MILLAAAFTVALFVTASSKELPRDARTSEEHLKLAGAWHAQSKALREESRSWSAMADDYARNPASHPIPKFPTWGDHCRTLSRQCLKAAGKAEALALAEERMAASH